MIKHIKGLGLIIFCLLGLYGACQPAQEQKEVLNSENELVLKDGWDMQAAAKASLQGTDLSTQSYQPTGWYKISVPTTIIGGLLANHYYDFDPFMGQNFKKLADPT